MEPRAVRGSQHGQQTTGGGCGVGRGADRRGAAAGALLPLNGGHNVSKDQIREGVSFVSLLEKDLQSFKEGLQCR